MSANITDYFNKASDMSGSYPPVATVTAARSSGGSTLNCDDLAGWATDTPVHFSTFQVTADGSIDTSTQTDWKGIVNGNNITDMTRLAGAADSGNASGDRVELNPTIGWLDDLITGLLVSHKQNGGLKDNAVTESTISTGAVTSSKIASGAISSYDKIGDDVIQARNINFPTFGGNSAQLTITGSVNSNSTSYKDCSGTYTIPETGLYFLYSFVSTASATSTKFGLAGRVLLDSTVISIDPVYADSYPNRSSNNFAYLYIATAFWANKDSIIKLQTKMDNWTGKSTHHTTIQRIF